MVLLLAVDLFRANMGFNPAIPTRTAVPAGDRGDPLPAVPASQPLHRRQHAAAHASRCRRTWRCSFGLYDARGYDFPVEKHFDALWRQSVAPGVGDFTQPEEFAVATPASLRALSLLSVSDLLVGPLQAIKFPLHGPGLHVAYRGQDGVVYANDRAPPASVRGRPPANGDRRRRRAGRRHRPGLRRARRWR